MKTKETFLSFEVDIVVKMHYIICIEDGAEHGVQDGSGKREGTELWSYGLTLNQIGPSEWFNVKPFLWDSLILNLWPPRWFNIKPIPRDSLTLNHFPNCTKKSKLPHHHPARPDLADDLKLLHKQPRLTYWKESRIWFPPKKSNPYTAI